MSASSNISSIVKVGAPKVNPTFTVLDGSPVSISATGWNKLYDMGVPEPYSGQYFEDGLYSVDIKVKITDEEYEFDPYVRCNIDDYSWSYPGDFDNSNDRADTVCFSLMTLVTAGEASELPEIKNAHIEGDYLYWEPLDGMDDYAVYIGNSSNIVFANEIPIYLPLFCEKIGVPFGTYEVKVVAFDFNSPAMEATSKMATAGMYTYGEKPQDPQEPQKIVIKSATVQSNVNEILKVGGKAEDAKLTSDVPQLFIRFGGSWSKMDEYGDLSYYGGNTFTPGKYKFICMAYLNPEYVEKYEIDDGLQLIIDGKACECDSIKTIEQNKVYFFYSPEYIAVESSVEPEPVEKEKISSATANSNYQQILKIGEGLKEPSFEVNGNVPITINGYWLKRDNDSGWQEADGNASAGSYRYEVELSVKDGYADTYELANDFALTVNGTNWTRVYSFGSDDDFLVFHSEDIELKAPVIEKTEITTVNVTSNMAEIFGYGKTKQALTFNVDGEDVNFNSVFWQKKVGDEWKVAYGLNGDTFDPGLYRYRVAVSAKENDHYLSDDFKLIVDGQEWTLFETFGKDTYGNLMGGLFHSPEVEIKDSTIVDPEPVEKEEISVAEFTSNIAELLASHGKMATSYDTSDDRLDYIFGMWERKVGDEWEYITYETRFFTPGTYRQEVSVGLFDENSCFAQNIKLLVDGQEWTYIRGRNDSDGNLVLVTFLSPEFVVEDNSTPDPEPEPEPEPTPTPAPTPTPTPTPTPAPTPAPAGSNADASQGASTSSYTDDIPSGAITVSLPRTTASTAVATAGPSVLGANREAARAVTLKMSKLTDAQYKDAVIKNLSATPAGGLFRLETDRISCFDRAMLEAFAKKSNVDMQVLFPLGSKKISITIPAGYDINKLLDKKGYCGFLRLLAILGGEIVTK